MQLLIDLGDLQLFNLILENMDFIIAAWYLLLFVINLKLDVLDPLTNILRDYRVYDI